MTDDGILFRSFGTDVFKGDLAAGEDKSVIGLSSAEGYMLLMLRCEDGTCLTAALNNEVWNGLMLRAAQIVETTFGGTIIAAPPSTRRLN